MTARAKKTSYHIIRILVCAGALWLVAQGVTWHDRVTLTGDRGVLVGEVQRDGAVVTVIDREGQTHSLALSEVAQDEDGVRLVTLGLKSTWHAGNKWFLLLAVALHFPVIFPQALRFRWLLSAQGIQVGYRECLRLSFAGNFLNFVAPLGSNAGDVFKAYYVSLHTEHRTEAVTTVALDRIIGLSSLVMVVALITTMSPDTSRLAVLRPYMLAVLAALICGAVVYLSPMLRRYLIPWKLLRRLPAFNHIERVDQAARKLASHVGLVTAAVLMTVALQGLAMLAYFCVAIGVGLSVELGHALECFAYFYTGVVIQAVPITPQGLGTLELAYRYFFASFGTPSQIVCMAMAIRGVAFICSLPGLLVTVSGSCKPSELKAFEASIEETDPPRSVPSDKVSLHATSANAATLELMSPTDSTASEVRTV